MVLTDSSIYLSSVRGRAPLTINRPGCSRPLQWAICLLSSHPGGPGTRCGPQKTGTKHAGGQRPAGALSCPRDPEDSREEAGSMKVKDTGTDRGPHTPQAALLLLPKGPSWLRETPPQARLSTASPSPLPSRGPRTAVHTRQETPVSPVHLTTPTPGVASCVGLISERPSTNS